MNKFCFSSTYKKPHQQNKQYPSWLLIYEGDLWTEYSEAIIIYIHASLKRTSKL